MKPKINFDPQIGNGNSTRCLSRWQLLGVALAAVCVTCLSFANESFGQLYTSGPDEGDTYWTPNDIEFPSITWVTRQYDSDNDFFRFTAPADMKINLRTVGGTRREDPRLRLYKSTSTRYIEFDDDGGDGRNAKISFDAEGGTIYIVAVSGRRSGSFELRIDSEEIVVRHHQSADRNTKSAGILVTGLHGGLGHDQGTWDKRTHFGAQQVDSEMHRQFELQSYCLKVIRIERILSYGEFQHTGRVDSPLGSGRTTIGIKFAPRGVGTRIGNLEINYFVGEEDDRRRAKIGFNGNGVLSHRADLNVDGYSIGNTTIRDGFDSLEDPAHHHLVFAPFTSRYYRVTVIGIPNYRDHFYMGGSILKSGLSGEVANDYGTGYIWRSERIRGGTPLFIKSELDPDFAAVSEVTRFPANYSVYVFFNEE